MLVLTREPEQVIVLDMMDGRTIEVTICRVRGQRVRVGIDAPQEVNVYRKELGPREAA